MSTTAGTIDTAACALAAVVADLLGLDGNETADLTNELLACIDEFTSDSPDPQ